MQSNNLHYTGAEKKKEITTPCFKELGQGLYLYEDPKYPKRTPVYFEIGSRIVANGKNMRIEKIMGRTIVLKTD